MVGFMGGHSLTAVLWSCWGMNLLDLSVMSRRFLKSKLLKRGPRSFLGRQVGMKNYSRSHFGQGKGLVVKSSRSIAGRPPGFLAQMSGKRLRAFSLHHIFSAKQRLLLLSQMNFSALHCLLLLFTNITCMKITGRINRENVRKRYVLKTLPSNITWT